ncbi:hypothetical protein EV421DRAFT_1766739, partial [Armillaria borealis]
MSTNALMVPLCPIWKVLACFLKFLVDGVPKFETLGNFLYLERCGFGYAQCYWNTTVGCQAGPCQGAYITLMASLRWVEGGCNLDVQVARFIAFEMHAAITSQRPVSCFGAFVSMRAKDTVMVHARNPCHLPLLADSLWVKGTSVTAQTGDKCHLGSWAIYRFESRNTDGSMCLGSAIGRLACIFIPSSKISAGHGLIVVEEFTLGELHHKYGMPVLLGPSKHLVLDSAAIQFAINVQHDCDSAGCTPSGLAHRQQERLSSEATLRVIEHREADHFVVNMHAFHNARLLRKYLPRYLTVPRPLYSDRQQHHRDLGAALVVKQAEKRAETNQKIAKTRQRIRKQRKWPRAKSVDLERRRNQTNEHGWRG